MTKKFFFILYLVVLILQACTSIDSKSSNSSAAILFDDFNYQDYHAFSQHDWKARTETGHPGVKDASWSIKGVSFHATAEGAQNGSIRLTAYTDGTSVNTQHTQICHARKYREGTYAARIYFRGTPTQGPDGDEIIETFYAISPLKAPMDLDYSEADFEYLPNGGWGVGEHALWATTWETFQLEPWTKVNEYATLIGSFEGWHILLLQVADNSVRYFIDGKRFAEHSDQVYPEEAMSINFNLWFTVEGLIDSNELRQYDEDIDWVYHEANAVLSTFEVEQKVAVFRQQKIHYHDSVPAWTPPLDSPCGL